MSAYKFMPRAVASPDAPQKPLVRKSARSGGANWVQVTRDRSPSKAKRPRTAGSQQPACTHKEHQILTTTEAASFASQFWDRKVHHMKALQHEFLATCIDVNLEKNVKHAQWHKCTRKRGHQTTYFIPYRGARRQICKTQFLQYFKISRSFAAPVAEKCDHPPPPTHTFLKRPFLTDFKKYTHTPFYGTKFWSIGPKIHKNQEKCQKPTVLAHNECPREICDSC